MPKVFLNLLREEFLQRNQEVLLEKTLKEIPEEFLKEFSEFFKKEMLTETYLLGEFLAKLPEELIEMISVKLLKKFVYNLPQE